MNGKGDFHGITRHSRLIPSEKKRGQIVQSSNGDALRRLCVCARACVYVCMCACEVVWRHENSNFHSPNKTDGRKDALCVSLMLIEKWSNRVWYSHGVHRCGTYFLKEVNLHSQHFACYITSAALAAEIAIYWRICRRRQPPSLLHFFSSLRCAANEKNPIDVVTRLLMKLLAALRDCQ